MSLPQTAIDRLFQRLAATYGAAWDRSMGSTPVNDFKAAWGHELAGFTDRMEAIAWALENLPENVPNVIQFRNLCRRAPEPEVPRLPEPKPDPVRLRAELAKLQPFVDAVRNGTHNTDRLAWARSIVARRKAGERVAMGTYRIAAEALAMHPTESNQ